MAAKPKPKPGKKITGKQAAIALGLAAVVVIGYVLWKRRQAASSSAATTAVPGGDVGAGGTLPFGTQVGYGGGGGGTISPPPSGGGGQAPPPPGSWQHHCNTSSQTTPLGPPGTCGWLWVDPTCTSGTKAPFGNYCESTTAPAGAPPPPSGGSDGSSPSSAQDVGQASQIGLQGMPSSAMTVAQVAAYTAEPIGKGGASGAPDRVTGPGQLTPIGDPFGPPLRPPVSPLPVVGSATPSTSGGVVV